MNDRVFLMWLHELLTETHNENPCVDYMHKLRSIIRHTPKKQLSPNTFIENSLEELKKTIN